MNYMTRTTASLCWHQASACHLVFQIALIPACAGPHHLVHCKMPLLQYCKAFWAALLEGGPFCFQGHPHFQETALQKGCSAPSDLYLHLSTVRTIHHFSLLTDPITALLTTRTASSSPFSSLYSCTPPWHNPQRAPSLQKGAASAQSSFFLLPELYRTALFLSCPASLITAHAQLLVTAGARAWSEACPGVPRASLRNLCCRGHLMLYQLTRRKNFLNVSRQIPYSRNHTGKDLLLYLATDNFVSPNDNEIINCRAGEVMCLIYTDEQTEVIPQSRPDSPLKPHCWQE